LVIDGKGQLASFEKDLAGTTFLTELKTILAYLEYAANGNLLPKTKMRDLTPAKDPVKEYEVKSKHLRVYFIQQSDGKLVIMGGQKNNQKKDIKKFRALKAHWLKQINSL
jgi:putative component of toxin-antitoxin plasmid stabilization module